MSGVEGVATFGFSDSDLLETSTSGLIERDIKVFRVGTFTDSFGRTRKWTGEDLDTAASNFKELRDLNILPNVPVRKDHSTSIKDVVAYFTDVRRDGNFLLADWEWVSEEAKHAWDRKQLRNRSIEIGKYTTNSGEEFNPTVVGLAFVDLPAVEGLYRIAEHGENMTTDNQTPEEIAEAAAAAEAEAAATAAAEAEVAAAAAAEAEAAAQKLLDDAADDALSAANDAAVAAGRELVGAHRRPDGAFAFRLDDSDVSDHARVQAHIVELETFRSETIQGARTEFVDALAAGNIVTAPQAEQFRSLVETMNVAQFEQFKGGFDGAQPNNLFGKHDLGDGGLPPGEIDAQADRISVLESIVANHRYRGATTEVIEKTGSFQELQTLKNATA